MNNINLNINWRLVLCVLICATLVNGNAFGARISDIRGTKHNLSAAADASNYSYPGGTNTVPARTVKATSETQICVFCHTPHGATLGVTPLWNRKLASVDYTTYTSSSLDAIALQGVLGQPGGSSKLCLSCHDGTLAIGSVNVLNGLGSADPPGTQAIGMAGTGGGGVMADGGGVTTGYTRNLGVSLSNDHPISVTYNSALSDRDGELRGVDANQKYPSGTGTIIGLRSSGLRPKAPLEPTGGAGAGQIQCAACHDPHLRETSEATIGNQKFLILNRFQQAAPVPTYSDVNDINCVTCHEKNNGAGTWVYSAHANADGTEGANQTYTAAAAAQNEFPAGLPVWKASCLNCHDTHTAQGSRWLLREGVASGASAIEETCYQCHTTTAASIVETGNAVPDVKSDFALSRHMPIKPADQVSPPATEAHDIGSDLGPGAGTPPESSNLDCSAATNNKCGADFVEKRTKLGAGDGYGSNIANRHAECTDCHNPHRTVKFQTFAPADLSVTPDATGTHPHTDTAMSHTNIASGALRGTFGVEPVTYASPSFASLPTVFEVKRGDPGTSTNTLVSASWVTREYQICLKCHSNYGYDDDNLPDGTTIRPALGGSGTPSGTNSVTHYTNQAKEFQSPVSHQGTESMMTDSGAAGTYADGTTQTNYRSWHPVMDVTGRTTGIRGSMNSALFNLPWSNSVGTQTMYCSDCHGSNVTSTTSVIPDGGETGGVGTTWGPHGSSNDFLLKGAFSSSTGTSYSGNVCFKCHSYNDYATNIANASAKVSGFSNGTWNNLHNEHVVRIGNIRCTWCHTAVPHGWKNKALLVNLNDVGPEVLCRQADADDQFTATPKCTVGSPMPAGTQMRNGLPAGSGKITTNTTWPNIGYTNPPYYLNAMNKINVFRASGAWTTTDCGSAGSPGNGNATGCTPTTGWSSSADEGCKNAP